MPRKRRQKKIPTPAWGQHHGAQGRRFLGRTPQFYAAAGLLSLVVVALGVLAFAFWSDYREAQQRPGSTAVQIDDTKYSLRYFSQRLKLYVQQVGGAGSQAARPDAAVPAVIDVLVDETLLRRFAPEMGISVSEEEIRDSIAQQLGLAADEPAFEARYRDELTRSGLDEREYRQMVEAEVIANKMRDKFAAELPLFVESAHYRRIIVSDQATADSIVQQLSTGADFAALAAEKSLDPVTKAQGGDAGWIPRGILNKELEDLLFGLKPGEVRSVPLQSGVMVVQLMENLANRPVDPQQQSSLADGKLRDWLDEKRQQVKVQEFVTQDEKKARWALDRAYGST